MSRLIQRMLGAARINVPTIDAIEADRSAIGQAMAVVALSATAVRSTVAWAWC